MDFGVIFFVLEGEENTENVEQRSTQEDVEGNSPLRSQLTGNFAFHDYMTNYSCVEFYGADFTLLS